MKHHLQRGTALTLTYTGPDGTECESTVPPVTVGAYRRALEMEATGEFADDPAALLAAQARALCGVDATGPAWLDDLDPVQTEELVQALLAARSGLSPEDWLKTLREVKKKALTAALVTT